MIEVIPVTGDVHFLASATFDELKTLVGGYVECVHVRENSEQKQIICNEDGRSLNLAHNPRATQRFSGKVLGDAVGTWVILSGKDLLT